MLDSEAVIRVRGPNEVIIAGINSMRKQLHESDFAWARRLYSDLEHLTLLRAELFDRHAELLGRLPDLEGLDFEVLERRIGRVPSSHARPFQC